MKNIHIIQNIYITNDEEIKDGNYGVIGEVIMSYSQMFKMWNETQGKKVILTTDQDLIKNGVQAIDDEFLQWFVKNPSCEKVEVVKDLFQINQNNPVTRGSTALVEGYKTIIPTEEPEQELLYWLETEEWKQFSKLVENNFGGKPKQETLK